MCKRRHHCQDTATSLGAPSAANYVRHRQGHRNIQLRSSHIQHATEETDTKFSQTSGFRSGKVSDCAEGSASMSKSSQAASANTHTNTTTRTPRLSYSLATETEMKSVFVSALVSAFRDSLASTLYLILQILTGPMRTHSALQERYLKIIGFCVCHTRKQSLAGGNGAGFV